LGDVLTYCQICAVIQEVAKVKPRVETMQKGRTKIAGVVFLMEIPKDFYQRGGRGEEAKGGVKKGL